ncbi:MAG: hypothetical protein A2X70_02775 [Alphaproteobacteria bacterium GWC2_42_16]|nr:MAG: hypothetical protein A2X70_02775 [Alphaproteobacteria bacterium GWC2_42_16]OFW73859.1 MAG: hypothetical protein A2Z80_03335 [Alphaproteobacteria bacterium GWA2_41_27]OFW82715.1 MAG: hypothetical protein A3E50_01030 [Alphaproteobacteria bacterium RIFCSPHIGHO2_12_FULL_42_100]OFW86546.1 MAG: hypothetical protein A2W06_07475 [Alphaproteobacteria bacterium RBG_16_42_14]OFW91869.1 MAG: hypothetical protein A3C41_03795 [Alphaproteobacteria bacterium RIFCSPHIGHO2_02_FULL_42_30]OFW93832.1 MAG: 
MKEEMWIIRMIKLLRSFLLSFLLLSSFFIVSYWQCKKRMTATVRPLSKGKEQIFLQVKLKQSISLLIKIMQTFSSGA